jgi:hypothetical protein
LWQAVARVGRGCLLPEALADLNERPPRAPVDARQLGYLLARYGQPFARRLMLLQAGRTPGAQAEAASPAPAGSMPLAYETLKAAAEDRLVLRDLVKMTARRTKKKILGS